MNNLPALLLLKKWPSLQQARRVIFHGVVWMVVVIMPYFMHYPPPKESGHNPDFYPFLAFNLFTTGGWAILFYLNALVLVPKLVYPKRYLLLTVTALVIISVMVLLHRLMFPMLLNDQSFELGRAIAFTLAPFVLTIAVSTTYKMLQDKSRTEHLVQQQQEENLRTELSFLRSQISPHFLFNVLNNMLALSRIKSDELEPTIFRLSALMRYMLYEADEDKVPLHKEIGYLHNYIDLQKQRMGSKVTLDIALETEEESATIAPMLLIPFIENAFKHGVTARQQATIVIHLTVKDNILNLFVSNFRQQNPDIKDKTSGIGLANVKRRLNLLYPGRHQLAISEDPEQFCVQLQLNLVAI
jgi:two-component system LytT family sensor kinase